MLKKQSFQKIDDNSFQLLGDDNYAIHVYIKKKVLGGGYLEEYLNCITLFISQPHFDFLKGVSGYTVCNFRWELEEILDKSIVTSSEKKQIDEIHDEIIEEVNNEVGDKVNDETRGKVKLIFELKLLYS